MYEKDSGVWAEARKPARTAVFSSPSRDQDLLIWVDVDISNCAHRERWAKNNKHFFSNQPDVLQGRFRSRNKNTRNEPDGTGIEEELVECGRGAVRWIKRKLKRGWRGIRIPRSPARYSSNLLVLPPMLWRSCVQRSNQLRCRRRRGCFVTENNIPRRYFFAVDSAIGIVIGTYGGAFQ